MSVIPIFTPEPYGYRLERWSEGIGLAIVHPMAPTLSCTGLRKSFGDRLAVDGVGFAIAPGETYGLLGPNGAGKTTTISIVCGLLARDAGEVELEGRQFDISNIEAKSAIGYVPQEIAVYPDLSARENLRFFGRLYGLQDPELGERVDDVLETVGLSNRAEDRTSEYSGGMKRRLNIGLGLLHRPRLLVLDEPTVGVDPQSRNAILDSVERLGAGGLAVRYTTHYMEEAERLCDRVGILDEGRLLAEGTRRELVSSIGAHDRVQVVAPGASEDALAALRTLPGVVEVAVHGQQVDLLVDDARASLGPIVQTVTKGGAAVSSVEVREPDLEGVFLSLTGKALRD
jgi:ABC-2 type transport system ATP-binding protein